MSRAASSQGSLKVGRGWPVCDAHLHVCGRLAPVVWCVCTHVPEESRSAASPETRGLTVSAEKGSSHRSGPLPHVPPTRLVTEPSIVPAPSPTH